MRLEHSRTFRRARRATMALTTAMLIVLSDGALAQRVEPPPLDVPYVPTPPEVVERMLDMASVREVDYVIDLGSGDGRIAVAAAKRGARALGIDIDPARIREAQDNARAARVEDRAQFRQQNLFEAKISDATVLMMYLLTKVNMDLRPRILQELKPGTRVVSHAFDMGNWKPDAESEIGHWKVFMWIVPANAAGRWRIEAGGRTFDLTLEQQYQHLTGVGTAAGGERIRVERGWLHGTQIHLTLSDGTELRGQVNGDRMDAMPAGDARKAKPGWHAVRNLP